MYFGESFSWFNCLCLFTSFSGMHSVFAEIASNYFVFKRNGFNRLKKWTCLILFIYLIGLLFVNINLIYNYWEWFKDDVQ